MPAWAVAGRRLLAFGASDCFSAMRDRHGWPFVAFRISHGSRMPGGHGDDLFRVAVAGTSPGDHLVGSDEREGSLVERRPGGRREGAADHRALSRRRRRRAQREAERPAADDDDVDRRGDHGQLAQLAPGVIGTSLRVSRVPGHAQVLHSRPAVTDLCRRGPRPPGSRPRGPAQSARLEWAQLGVARTTWLRSRSISVRSIVGDSAGDRVRSTAQVGLGSTAARSHTRGLFSTRRRSVPRGDRRVAAK